jgi:hypothetical protein
MIKKQPKITCICGNTIYLGGFMKHLLWSDKHTHHCDNNIINDEYMIFEELVEEYHNKCSRRVIKRVMKDKNYTHEDIERIFNTTLIRE